MKSNSKTINLEARHLNLVLEILSQAPKIQFYAFGSRVNGTNKQYSDLDLCFKGKLDIKLLRKLKNDFYESRLPFKVDLMAYKELPEAFGDIKIVQLG